MGELIRIGLETIGLGVVIVVAMLCFAVVCAVFAPTPKIHRDVFAEAEFKRLRAQKGGSMPKITRVAGQREVSEQEVDEKGRILHRVPPAQDMLDFLKKGPKP